MNADSADLILINADVVTSEPRKPFTEALAVKGERILMVGSNKKALQLKGAKTTVVDCGGKTLVPGFNDAHCHIFSFMRTLFAVDLSPASVKSIADIKAAVLHKALSTPGGSWIRGSGYNEFYLAEKRHPTRRDLDEVSLYHPVFLIHRSQHACVLNSLALQLAGITTETEEPPGGLIERDLETGEPDGVLFEMLDYVRTRIPSPLSEAELERGIAEVNRSYLCLGITSIGEATATNDLDQWHSYQKIKQEGDLQSRIYMMPGIEALGEFQKAGLRTGSGDNGLRVGSVKIVITEARGQLEPPQADLNRMVLEASRASFQVAIHAVERSTVEAAIAALEYAHRQSPLTSRRHRIEHCSECPPELQRRLRKLQAVIVSQPPFIYYSGERYLSQVSASAQPWLYPFKSLLGQGITVAGSSDSPIAPINPLTGVYAASTRLAASGQPVLPSEAISCQRALEMYTLGGAYASCEENIKGSLAPGKLADIVMLSDNPLRSLPEQLKEISAEMTILGGKIVWEKS